VGEGRGDREEDIGELYNIRRIEVCFLPSRISLTYELSILLCATVASRALRHRVLRVSEDKSKPLV
jgi:hypothetical protein